MTPPPDILVPAPTEIGATGDCESLVKEAASSPVRPRLRLMRLLAIPELKLDQNPLTIVPIPVSPWVAEVPNMPFFV